MALLKEGVLHRAMDYGVIVPQGWRMDLVGIADPVEAYEAMTRVAQEAEALGLACSGDCCAVARESSFDVSESIWERVSFSTETI